MTLIAEGIVGAVTRHQLLLCARAWWAAGIPMAPSAWTVLIWWLMREVSLAATTRVELEQPGAEPWQAPLLLG